MTNYVNQEVSTVAFEIKFRRPDDRRPERTNIRFHASGELSEHEPNGIRRQTFEEISALRIIGMKITGDRDLEGRDLLIEVFFDQPGKSGYVQILGSGIFLEGDSYETQDYHPEEINTFRVGDIRLFKVSDRILEADREGIAT